ncbi:Outer membrane protein ArfA [Thalassovita gelatinovora]|uniref:Outer membrane protein ArfA n=1 Tax=Thalassovita gelatinovora TaxID=53501 RepID=A0A0N7LVT2_THAGE|nr:OmpA family protein [Thalassovita gelatinovora]QIZ81853.1 OmpA family protein [Thalassovita gelatinovora]CUH67170.1 Outer membrane protein ArfA [Thalassovita gelatinovora]SEP79361.1 OmpA-OmpF porin, OOP family [Thalassovita gelatinovora]
MRLSSLFLTTAPFAIAAVLGLVVAQSVADVIEDSSELSIRNSLDDHGLVWAEVHANGLQVFLSGMAPSEAQRFKALSTAGGVVDAARVIDAMKVVDSASIKPPRFSIEILRNDSGISLIGLVPTEMDREKLVANVKSIAGSAPVSDLLQTADYDTPESWVDSVDYAIKALRKLPRSKISVEAGAITVHAMTDSADAKRSLERDLSRSAGHDLKLALDISAPRPVITPFTLRFLIEDGTARFDACSASDAKGQKRILAAAQTAGLQGEATCTIGLGVPSPRWAEAVELAIAAVAELGGGSVTFADADITLAAPEGTNQALFDRVVGELENSLPDLFALHPALPKPKTVESGGTPEFTATLSPEGQVQLRGRLSDELSRSATDSYAKARFGSDSVYVAARLDDTLPGSWPMRVLAGLEALSHLSNGVATVTPDMIAISGKTGKPDASAEISRLLVDKLGENTQFDIHVEYLEKLDPVASIPTPEECEFEISEILKTRKINFEPGSDTPDADAQGVLNDIAEILKLCGEIRMEVGGHTDSQGRESMNEALSQLRAQAVLNALRERRVLTSTFAARGYGESMPVASNETEEGRDANRRIEFKLIRPEPTAIETETTLEIIASEAAENNDGNAVEEETGDTTTDAPEDEAAIEAGAAEEGTQNE